MVTTKLTIAEMQKIALEKGGLCLSIEYNWENKNIHKFINKQLEFLGYNIKIYSTDFIG